MTKAAIIDYGVGNLFSLTASLKHIGADCIVTSSPAELEAADRVILPGVGAFGDAMAKLRVSGLEEVVLALAREGRPLLGICLGMQMLFEKSFEYGEHKGLGLISGTVESLRAHIPETMKVPQIGWNSLHFEKPGESIRSYLCTVTIHLS